MRQSREAQRAKKWRWRVEVTANLSDARMTELHGTALRRPTT